MADPNIKIRMSVELEEAAEAVADFARKTRDSLDNAFTTSVERAKKTLDELDRKYKQVQATIDADKQKIDELSRKREDAGKEAAKLIEQEIEGLKRIVAGREQEKLKLEEKKVKLEEVGRLAVATTDAEKEGIREATNARIAEIAALKDQQRAQQGLNTSIDEGSGAAGSFFGRFLGVGAALSGVQLLIQGFRAQREEIDATLASFTKLQNATLSQHDKFKSVFNEFGIRGGDEQNAAQATLTGVGKAYGVDQEAIAGVASRLASASKVAGMNGVNDPRFQSIVGNIGMYTSQGFDQDAAADYAADLLHENKNITGEEIGQKLANLKEAMGGSPRRASEVLQGLQEQRGILKNTGLTDDDFIRANVAMMKNGVPEDEAKTLSRQVFQSLNRLKGLSPKELASEHSKMQSFGETATRALGMYEKFYSPEQMLQQQESLRSGGVPELDQLFEQGIKSGHLDIRAFASTVSGLSGDKLDRVAKVFGGPRNVVGMGQAAGFGSVTLPTSAQGLSPLVSDADRARIEKEQAEAASAAANPVVAGAFSTPQMVENAEAGVKANRQELPFFEHGFGKVFTLGFASSDKQKAVAIATGQELMKVARRIREIDSGNIKATPEQRAALQNSAVRLLQRMQSDPTHPDNDAWVQFSALAYGKADFLNPNGGYTREGVLDSIPTDKEQQYLREWLPFTEIPEDMSDANKIIPIVGEAEKNIDATTPRPAAPVRPHRGLKPAHPATQPTSVNYNSRNYYYGYTPGSMAAPVSYDNRMG